MADEAQWGKWVNSLRAEDLPIDGKPAPDLEIIPPPKDLETLKENSKQKVYVQRLTTQVYLYTDLENHVFGQATFQDVSLFGEMTIEKLSKILDREKKKRSKGDETAGS